MITIRTLSALFAFSAITAVVGCGSAPGEGAEGEPAPGQQEATGTEQKEAVNGEALSEGVQAEDFHAQSCRGGEGFTSAAGAKAFCHRIFDTTPGPNRGKGLIKLIEVRNNRGFVIGFNVECCN